MASPSLKLDVEKALKTFITQQNLFNPTIDIHAASEADLALDGTYLAIVSTLPNWYKWGGYNAELAITFKFATVISDPATRLSDVAAHSARAGALIDLLCDQRFNAVQAALNLAAVPFYLGFDSWQETGQERSNTETQVVSSLAYEFMVHLTF